jgi:putative adenylate-forming enzyme
MPSDKLQIAWEYLKAKRLINSLDTEYAVDRYQDEGVKNMLKRVLPKSPYYAKLFKGLNIKDWANFPITTKEQWMENFDDINTVGIKKEEAFKLAKRSEASRDFEPMINGITVGLSSGTSGSRGLWLVSPSERHAWAANILAKHLPRGIFSNERIAFFLRANSNLYNSLGTSKIQFRYFDMLESLEYHIERLNEYQPTILSAPPSMLLLLANSSDLHINPKKVISAADVLDDSDKIRLESYFDCRIDQFYMATEGFIASTCIEGMLHINEDCLVIQKEWLDASTGRYTPIITDFRRMTQPIIRYKLNDVLIQGSASCRCNSPFETIEKIEGRCDDILYYQNKEGNLTPIFPDFIRNYIISHSNAKDYYVRQRSYETLDIYLDVDKPDSFNLEEVFKGKTMEPTIIYHKGVPIRRQDEKMRRVASALFPKNSNTSH